MKKLFSLLLSSAVVLSLCLPAAASASPAQGAYTISVNGSALDLSALPTPPYQEGDVIMVPLRMVGEALGYQVDWDPASGDITIDDLYIQRAVLRPGSASAEFQGRLSAIDLSRTVENEAPTAVHSGRTYVPLSFFTEFLNDAAADGTSISISPSMVELDDPV